MSERILRSRTRKSIILSKSKDKKMSSRPEKEEVQNFLNSMTQDRKERRRSRSKRVVFSSKKYTSDDLANGDALKSFDPRDGTKLTGILKWSSSDSDSTSASAIATTPKRAKAPPRSRSRSGSGSPLLSALALAVSPVSPQQRKEARRVAEEDDNVRRSFEFYRDAGEWWNVFPKTDYTYSRFSTHRREVSPGVMAVPNMSRVGIGGVDVHVQSPVDSALSDYSSSYRSSRLAKSTRRLSFDSDSDEVDTSSYIRSETLPNQRHVVNNSWRKTSSTLMKIASIIVLFVKDIPFRVFGKRNERYSYGASRYSVRERRINLFSRFWSSMEKIFSNVYWSISNTLVFDSWILSNIRSSSHSHEESKSRRLWLPLLGLLLILFFAWWMGSDYLSDPLVSETSATPNYLQNVRSGFWNVVSHPWYMMLSVYEKSVWLLFFITDVIGQLLCGIAEAPKRLFSCLLDLLLSLTGIFVSLLNMIFTFSSPRKVELQDASFLSDFPHIYSADSGNDLKLIIEAAVREREAVLLSEMHRLMAEREQALRLELARKEEELYARMFEKSEHVSAIQQKQDTVPHKAEVSIREELKQELQDQKHALMTSLESLKDQYDAELGIRDAEIRQSKNIIEKKAKIMAQLEQEQSSLMLQLANIQKNIQEISIKGSMQHDSWSERASTLSVKVLHLQNELQRVWRRVGACCGRTTLPSTVSSIQNHVRSEVNRLFSSPEGALLLGAAVKNFSEVRDAHKLAKEPHEAELGAWISAAFVSKGDFEQALMNLTSHFYEELDRRNSIMMSATTEEITERLSQQQNLVWSRMAQWRSSLAVDGQFKNDRLQTTSSFTTGEAATTLDESRIRRIVDSAIALYDADKTGMADYALESQGGEVVSTRCSETYQVKSPTLSLFGVPLWYPSNSPRTVIQPGMRPGECWAFVGAQGFLVIQLSHRINVKGFTYEHVSPVLLPTGKMDSAPKEFSVYGLHSEVDIEPVLLGNYIFLENSTSLQYFPVQHLNAQPLQLIELQIKSNHGNINYTCLYRFRVHGTIA